MKKLIRTKTENFKFSICIVYTFKSGQQIWKFKQAEGFGIYPKGEKENYNWTKFRKIPTGLPF